MGNYGAPFVSKLLRKLWIQKTKIDSIYVALLQKSAQFLCSATKIDPILITRNRPDFYDTKIDPIFITRNRPDFYDTKIDPIFMTQKSTRFYNYVVFRRGRL